MNQSSNSDTPSAAEIEAFGRVLGALRTMLDDKGCEWHRAQTHESLTRYLVEEAAEVVDAIDRCGDAATVAEELGDVLYQVLFHAEIAGRDREGYDLERILNALADKLVRRHPHVFSDRGHMTVAELDAEWEHLKENAAGRERGSRGVFEGVPAAMPTLAKAVKMVDRLRRAGVEEMVRGARDEAQQASATATADERAVGRELLEVIQRSVARGVDADRALRVALIELESQTVKE